MRYVDLSEQAWFASHEVFLETLANEGFRGVEDLDVEEVYVIGDPPRKRPRLSKLYYLRERASELKFPEPRRPEGKRR